MKHSRDVEVMPVIKDPKDFDESTGMWAERVVFNNRFIILILCILMTLAMSYFITGIRLNANFEKTIPTGHPYIVNYLNHKTDLGGLGNAVRIAVESTEGTIYNVEYLDVLQKVHDEAFLLPGVDRMNVRSLWAPATRWTGITEVGFAGGSVISSEYDRSPESVEQIRRNVEQSGTIGHIVALNHKSSIVSVPLLAADAEGSPIDYGKFSEQLESIREKYESDTIKIHITGFAKVMGDMIDGIRQIMFFFIVAVIISAAVLFWYTRCIRSTLVVVFCSVIAVIWQLGLSASLGYELDPYSVLVPFLVFAIAMSHGSQKMNGILQDAGRGTCKLIAARYTFRRLFLPGVTALVSDTFGFAVLLLIDIGAIRELAIIASIGVAVVIFTNLILVPVLLSYVGVSRKAALRSLIEEETGRVEKHRHPIFVFLDRFTERKYATIAIIVSCFLFFIALWMRQDLRIGDLDPGAPELRVDSRYNKDNDFIVSNYGASSDVLAIMVKTTPDYLFTSTEAIMKTDALEWELRQSEGVESTNSLALLNRQVCPGITEGSPKWYDVLYSQNMMNFIANNAGMGMYNESRDLIPLYVYLKDHKADTLTSVVNLVEGFAKENNTEDVQFLLAAGSAGIEAATNIVVEKANRIILVLVYTVVIAMCYITFRSWRAVACAILPLILTSVMAEGVMAQMGIGVKVSTLPVIALGVGIGVDYALYILNVVLGHYRAGHTLAESFYRADLFTGKVVMLIGITLSVAVATWVFSPIKFQADMGLMLAFMFMVNMLGALILHPALAHFLYLKTGKM
ncbi:MAG: RND family transporter [Deltaproteobacteria bacterium]|nr:RND family transporter [Deltaproteobacteria bacterium]